VEGMLLGIFQSVSRFYTAKLPTVIEENQIFSRMKSGSSEGRYEAVGIAACTFNDKLFPGRSDSYTTRLSRLLSPPCVAFTMCIAANCSWSSVYCIIILCVSLLPHVYCFTLCVLLSHIL